VAKNYREDLLLKIDIAHHPEKIHATVYIAPGVVVVGDVTIEEEASLWFGAIVRGDVGPIVIGRQTNIQDGCIVHTNLGQPCILGARVSLGHGAVIHGAAIEDDVMIGMRATVLNGSRIGRGSIVAAGALVAPGTIIPPKSMVMGVPGKVIRPTGEVEETRIRSTAERYCVYARKYLEEYPRS
jgi:carbonic anhydrase/acetyltransferase-like protein (isoleucine patch superfamily)